jgi:hypothetical protein
MNIFFFAEDSYNEKVLLARGVPAAAVRVLGHPAASTGEKIREILGLLNTWAGFPVRPSAY